MEKKKRITRGTVLWILIFLIGLGVLLYPTISDKWNQHVANLLLNEYDSVTAELDAEDIEKIRQDAIEYNKTLIGTIVPDAFADRENKRDSEYESLLNPNGSGIMGSVEVPCISVVLPIYHYTNDEVLEKGAGHLPGSSLPVGGETTHTVISAHRGLPSAKMFTDLDRVKEGDTFFLHVLDETLAYEVDFIKVIEPENTQDLSIVEGEDYCTLFTCTPYAVNTHRLIVRGHRVPYTPELYLAAKGDIARPLMNSVVIRALCVAAGIQIALIIILVRSMRAKKKDASPKGGRE